MLKSVWKFKQNMAKSHKTCMEQAEIIDTFGTYHLPSTLYRILAKSFCPIKGYESTAEEVIGIMKNIRHSLCMSGPINVPDFFFRTLVDAAQNPHVLKPYAPWIMKLIKVKTGIDFQPAHPNHRTYLPPVEVLQNTIASNAK